MINTAKHNLADHVNSNVINEVVIDKDLEINTANQSHADHVNNNVINEIVIDQDMEINTANQSHADHEYSSACLSCEEKSCTIAALRKQIKALQSDIIIQKKLSSNISNNFRCENVFKSDKSVRFYTGIPSVASFNAMFLIIKPKVQTLRYWKGPKHFTCNILKNKISNKRGPKQKLSAKEEMTMVLMKLRLGLLNQDLADRFGVSQSHVSCIFNTWIKVLSKFLISLVFNPTKDIVQENLPPTFRNKTYSSVRHIIDCSEVYLETPHNLEMQSQTWSDYKHHHTGKFLLSINPSGLINFVSKCWGGRTSDKYITNHCGFLDILEPLDTVMADRGFQIRDELTLHQSYLLVPPGRRGACQMSNQEVKKTKQIANRRIYIEQAIRRVKCFRILKHELPITLVPHLDDIVQICCGICNLYPPLPRYEDNNK